eukprot:scaffold318728_cov15-Prasinocladus_malaysianus.AAC.1
MEARIWRAGNWQPRSCQKGPRKLPHSKRKNCEYDQARARKMSAKVTPTFLCRVPFTLRVHVQHRMRVQFHTNFQ